MTVYQQQLDAKANPQVVAMANLLTSQHKQNLSNQHQIHHLHQVTCQQHQQIISQMTRNHHQQFLETTLRHNREINQLHEKHNQERLQVISVASTTRNVIDSNQIPLFLQRQQSQVHRRQNEHYQEMLQLNNNHTQQMLHVTTQQHDLQRRYEREQSSTLPPLGYGETHPHASPLGPSGYLNKLRNITAEQRNQLLTRYGRLGDGAQPGLHETKPGKCCLLFGCKIAHMPNGQLFCVSHNALLIPIPTGHNLLGNEVNFRGAGLALDIELIIDGVTCGLKPDMSRVTDTAVDLYENDPPEHASSKYGFQVGRDKSIFEWAHRVSGKNIRQLRWLHRNYKENTIPEDIIIWFILLMHYTDFMGATGDIIALVSIGKASKRWRTLTQQYETSFEGLVVGYELFVKDDGSFGYNIVDFSCSGIMDTLCKYQNIISKS